jgi:hypothetical protein
MAARAKAATNARIVVMFLSFHGKKSVKRGPGHHEPTRLFPYG